ncbi:hypothetical protein [Flavobacterium sp. 140616W15]|uniref:hypothetical protein n=1 Tax=Flavobacterium sp. 140616W15 TaxID=2478552 RepID=UPI000F0CE5E6|nr:hypothetical protein [Flavobacterium sp. 140616W15]AYN03107.1 hypothetical protein EAG11_02155 [Flavobacterium sp. 140616W15]
METSNNIEQNEYAKNSKEEVIFILDAVSGRKGYWCLSCDKEMQAVHFKNEIYKSYFRHDAKDVKIERKCTFRNEEYRHKLAITILQESKSVKVPNLNKYSADGKKAVLLEESEFIIAKSVKVEQTFYEDDEGNIKWGKNPDIEDRNLLFRPDLAFFNTKGEPILLIEIVVTHKLSDEKKVKIRRLGIDTIQIKIPKDSHDNIVKSLKTSTNTKWVYNELEERTDFLQVSKGNREEILSIDEFEREFFQESLACRKSQISNLIRSIGRSLEGQQYRNNVFQLEQELSRIKTNTDRNRERLEQLRKEHRDRVTERFRDSYEQIESQEREFAEYIEREQGKLANEYYGATEEIKRKDGNLEARYLKRRGELTNLQREIEYRTTETEISIDGRGGIGEKAIRIQESSIRIQREIENEEVRTGKIRESRKSIRRRIELLPFEFENRERELGGQFAQEEAKLESAPERYRDSIIQTIDGTTPFTIELPDRIKKLLEARRILDDYESKQFTLKRYKFMLESVRKGI